MQLPPYLFQFHTKSILEDRIRLRHDAQPVFLPVDAVLEVRTFGAADDEARLDCTDREYVCAEDGGEGVRGDGGRGITKYDGELP